jgi:transcriptional regulator GlxA family with amidase domain
VLISVRTNIGEMIQVEDLSKKANMGRASFHRAFKREFSIARGIYPPKENKECQIDADGFLNNHL